MKKLLGVLILFAVCVPAQAAEISESIDPETGWTVIAAQAGQTRIRLVPAAGLNVFSIEHAGRELLKTPPSIKELPGVGYGTPLLYPTPNRVSNAQFRFGDKTYKFDANSGTNFIHGLVHNVPWTVTKTSVAGEQAVIEAALEFAPGTEIFKRFPFPHTLRVTITLSEGAVRWAYTVDNRDGKATIPFGFALHPWFLYQGPRKETYLTIPATHWMEAVDLLPTGKLVELAKTQFDARKPKSLADFVIDDVYYGMKPDKPTTIDFRKQGVQILLKTSKDFTHQVVYTPRNAGWFCVENQTCSTDAHNLYERGLKDESHLLTVPPGGTQLGFVEYQIHDNRQHDFSHWEPAIRKFEARDRIQAPPAVGILFVGSSSIYFWDLPKYFPGRNVINRGFGGSEMIDSLYFADRIVLPYRPRTIVVYAGDNDIARKQSAETVYHDFHRFAKKVHATLPKTRIIYIAVKPSIKRWELYGEMAKANNLIAAHAATDARVTYADIATPMLNAVGKPREELFRKDGLHLNHAGYTTWTAVLEPLLEGQNE